ncbi:lamin tail domain-containing protein [Actinokineospora auranticolor]|uniref:Lamin tail-like protein n=1 Tax=Actinokineospora auranticolor TaxID=155976 RepID=A0A2S6GZJ7_9PSEU|nr:lamin tail domain-containing protein [Actinokineospora auranticolor]PPK70580.1 hypothetical protein CLV40_102495 [Actinokineospora auranticolor]
MRRFLTAAVITATLASGAAVALSSVATAAPDSAPLVSSTVLVNEVATRGPNGAQDEFVEIRNVSLNYIDLSNYVLRVYSSTNVLVDTIPLMGIQLAPRSNPGEFVTLLGPNFSGTADGQTLPYAIPGLVGIPDNGGVAIYSVGGAKVDGVAFSAGANNAREGAAALSQVTVDDQLAAANGRDVVSSDTDNNQLNFSRHVRTPGALN